MSQTNGVERLESEQIPLNCQLFKHSTQCPVSTAARDAVHATSWELPTFQVNVIEQRTLSNWISATLTVRHESPQLIYIRDGKVTEVLNHSAIGRALRSR